MEIKMIRNLVFLLGVRNLDLKKDNHGNCTTNRARESSLPRPLQTEIDTRLNSKSKKTKKTISGLRILISGLVWTRKGKQWAENPMLHLDLHDGRLLNRSIQLADEIITSQFLGRRGFTKRVQKRCVAFWYVQSTTSSSWAKPPSQDGIHLYTFNGVSGIR